MTLTIRLETPADREAIDDINRQAFGRAAEAWLVGALRESPAFIPALSLVAEQDGLLTGHILFSQGEIRDEDRSTPALILGPVAVRPERQNQGIGSALIRAGLDRARELRHRIVILIGHPNYYPRFGFAPARAQGLETTFKVSDPVFMALALVPGALDGVRGTVVFPPPFDEV